MAKFFKDVVQDSPRTGLGIPVKTKNTLSRTNTPPTESPFGFKLCGRLVPAVGSRPLGKPTSRDSHGRNKRIPSPNDVNSQVRPRRRTAGASPDAISTGPRCRRALHAHRAPSSSSPG